MGEKRMRIAICDDRDVTRDKLKWFCKEFFARKNLHETVVEEYASGEEYLEEGGADIVLLDIEMGGMDGIEVKKELARRQENVRVLFVTSHEEAMEDAYGRNVCGFLKKPLTYENFAGKMEEVLWDMEAARRFIEVCTSGNVERVYMDDVLYLKASGKDVDVYTVGGRLASVERKGIGQWAEELKGEGFVLSHKSYLVHLLHVKKVDKEVVLDNGERLRISKERKVEFKKKYWDYMREHAR